MKNFSNFLLKVSALSLHLQVTLSYCFYRLKEGSKLILLQMEILAPVLENIIFSSLHCHNTYQIQLTINVQIYFWTFNSIVLICIPIIIPYLDYWSFIVSFEMGSWCLLTFHFIQDCLEFSKLFTLPNEF